MVLCCSLGLAYGYGSGAPPEVCDDMTPKHPAKPQPSNTYPYLIRVEKNRVKPGESTKVTIEGKKGESFQGFLLEARVGSIPTGQFSSHPEAKTIDCGSAKKNAVTHTNPSVKKSMSVVWTAPKDLQESVQFIATVAKNGGEFWVAQKGPVVAVSK